MPSLLAEVSCPAQTWDLSSFYPGGTNAACWASGRWLKASALVQAPFAPSDALLGALYQNTVALQLVDMDGVVQHARLQNVSVVAAPYSMFNHSMFNYSMWGAVVAPTATAVQLSAFAEPYIILDQVVRISGRGPSPLWCSTSAMGPFAFQGVEGALQGWLHRPCPLEPLLPYSARVASACVARPACARVARGL